MGADNNFDQIMPVIMVVIIILVLIAIFFGPNIIGFFKNFFSETTAKVSAETGGMMLG